jgi:hypothetical protein
LLTNAGINAVGKTTIQMQTESTFTDAGWDFVDTWKMAGYPKLIWEKIVLVDINIDGATSLAEYQSSQYTCTATYANGGTADISSNTAWSENSSYASLTSSGLLTVEEVSSDQSVTITASYSYDNIAKVATYNVGIKDIPSVAYQLTVDNGSGDGLYFADTVVDIVADSDTIEQVFDSWSVVPAEYYLKLESGNSASTMFTMPSADVVITAIYMVNDIPYSGGSGTESDPYLIAVKGDLLELSGKTDDYDKFFKMTYDIDLDGESFNMAVIAPDEDVTSENYQGTKFTGVFDGNGKKILNLSIGEGSTNDFLGLFGWIDSGGEVKNLGIVDCSVSGGDYVGALCGRSFDGIITSCYSSGTVSGGDCVGGLCGYSSGSVTSCYSTGTVSGDTYVGGLCGFNEYGAIILSCYSTGAVSGTWEVGGLSGDNWGTLSSCYSTGAVSGDWGIGGICGYNHHGTILACYSTGAVRGGTRVGGLCGYSYCGTISFCYSTGSVSGTDQIGGFCGYNEYGTISSCYSTGAVSGTDQIGGLLGRNSGTISSCFWNTETSGLLTNAGINAVGKTTIQMQTESTFTDAGWDFDDTWMMHGYPRFTWEEIVLVDINIDGATSLAENNSSQYTCTATYSDGSSDDISSNTGWFENSSYASITSSGLFTTTEVDVNQSVTITASYTEDGITKSDTYLCVISNIVTLSSIKITGKTTIDENSSSQYTSIATYSDGHTNDVTTSSTWIQDSSYATINSDGILIVESVSSDQSITITANYNENGVEAVANYIVTVLNVKYSGGTGTESDPYLILNKADLLDLGMNTDDYDNYFKMTEDIDLSGETFTTAIVGTSSNPFIGVFDGNGCKILNLDVTSSQYVGLFGCIGLSGDVKNLGVVDCCMTSSYYAYVGGLCGLNYGTIFSCYSTGEVSGESCLGGLVGYNYGTILNCYSSISVSGDNYLGGFVGINGGIVSDCYSVGNVYAEDLRMVGGFVGGNEEGSVLNCFWNIETSNQHSDDGAIGKSTDELQKESTFTDAGWDFDDTWKMNGYPILKWQTISKELSSIFITGALAIDENTSSQYTCMSTYSDGSTADISSLVTWTENSNYASINSSGLLTTTDVISEEDVIITASYTEGGVTMENTHAVTIINKVYNGGAGTELNPYLITTKADLLELSSTTVDYDKYFKMTADVDLAGEIFSKAVIAADVDITTSGYQGSKFTGVFDGDGHVVRNLTINSGGADRVCLGLFGWVQGGGSALIKNIGIENASISCGDDSYFIAGLCGVNFDSIENCCFAGIITIGASSQNNAGLCGFNAGTVNNCYAIGEITVGTNSSGLGGLCGLNSGGTIDKCYSAMVVSRGTGSSAFGGFCGFNSGTINSCFWDTQTSGMLTSAGGIGKTTVLMQTQSTFVDWDFANLWKMNGYPQLLCMLSPYERNLIDCGVPKNEQGYTDCPSGDGIQNLLKYAIGLNPMEACSSADLMEPMSDVNEFAILYRKSKRAVDVELFPTWSVSLIVTNWETSGFEFEKLSETASNETWKATLPMTNECGYIRLKATTEH